MKNTFKKLSITSILGAALLLSPATTLANSSEGKALAEMSFESVRRDGKDYITPEEVEIFRGSLFLSMDQDDNNSLSFEEYFEWDYGFKLIAEETGKEKEYLTALKIVFALWDLDGDRNLTNEEHKTAVSFDFKRADFNKNQKLEKSEFLGAFSINIALRAALKD